MKTTRYDAAELVISIPTEDGSRTRFKSTGPETEKWVQGDVMSGSQAYVARIV